MNWKAWLFVTGLVAAVVAFSLFHVGPASHTAMQAAPSVAQAGLWADVKPWLVGIAIGIALIALVVLIIKVPLLRKPNKWVLAAIAVAGVYLYGAYINNWKWDYPYTDELKQVPYWILAAAVGFGIVAIYLGDKKKLKALLVMSCVIIMTYVTYLLYSSGAIVGDVGMKRNVLYVFAGGLVALAAMYITNWWQKFVAFCLFGAIFTMVGYSHFDDWRGFTNKLASISFFGKDKNVASTPSLPTGLPVYEATLTTFERTPLVPDPRSCKIDWKEVLAGQCVHVYGANKKHLGNDCNGPIDLTNRSPESFSAATTGSPVKIRYTLQCNS